MEGKEEEEAVVVVVMMVIVTEEVMMGKRRRVEKKTRSRGLAAPEQLRGWQSKGEASWQANWLSGQMCR